MDEDGLTLVFDSGKDFEELSNKYIPEYFNCSNDDKECDSRSPKKGPEPERGTVSAYTVSATAADKPDIPEATLPMADNAADTGNSALVWTIVIAVIAVITVAIVLIKKK